jgi:type I restriction enzyme, S subunit
LTVAHASVATAPLVQLRHLCRILNGGTPPSGDAESWGGDVPFVTPTDLNGADGALIYATGRTLTERGAQQSGSAPSGSVILSTRAPIGYVGRLASRAAFNQGCRALVPNATVSDRFLAYALIAAREELAARGQGTTFPELSATALASVRLSRPFLELQSAIADYLDRETAGVDALIAKSERLIALLTERRAAVLANVLDSAPGAHIRLKYLAQIQTGVTLSGDGKATDPEWPYLRVANVQIGRVALEEVKTLRLAMPKALGAMLRPGDVLMTEGGDADKLGRGALWDGQITPMLHQNHVFAVRAGAQLAPRFLTWWLDGPVARAYFARTAKQTTNLASTNKATVGNLPIPQLTRSEQDRMVDTLDAQTSSLERAIATTRRGINLAEERRSALISSVVTGKLEARTAHDVRIEMAREPEIGTRYGTTHVHEERP